MRQRKLTGAVARFAERALQALLFVLGQVLRRQAQRGRDQNQSERISSLAPSPVTLRRLSDRVGDGAASSREMCR